MEKVAQRIGKAISKCDWISLTFIGFILFLLIVYESKESGAMPAEIVDQRFDSVSGDSYMNDNQTSKNKPEAKSTERKLNQYYARRQFLGSPPEIAHPVKVHGKVLECLICHEDGGWTINLKRVTPVTPHRELTNCMQCHVLPVTDTLFRAIDWRSLPPPRLGRTYLPGALPIG